MPSKIAAKRPSKKPSPLDIAKGVSGIYRPKHTWLDDLDSETKAGVIEAAREMAAGRLTNKLAIVTAWINVGIPVTYNKLNGLIRKIHNGEI